jgi:adenylate cyclase
MGIETRAIARDLAPTRRARYPLLTVGREIERKFLVASDAWRAHAAPGTPFEQGYLSTEPARTVRVRLAGASATLTIKGLTRGAARDEFEYPIPADDARHLLDHLCTDAVVKVRYVVPHEGHDWEIDVFGGANDGLLVAEIELDDEAEPFARPAWIGAEVTGDLRYYNANLAKQPFRGWRVEPDAPEGR